MDYCWFFIALKRRVQGGRYRTQHLWEEKPSPLKRNDRLRLRGFCYVLLFAGSVMSHWVLLTIPRRLNAHFIKRSVKLVLALLNAGLVLRFRMFPFLHVNGNY